MNTSKLEKEFQYYINNQDELVKNFEGNFIVIKNCEIIGDYTSEIIAIQKTMKKHQLGTFLIQECRPGKENYTQTFHSRFLG